MKVVPRSKIKDETFREILDVETHHNHEIVKDEHGDLRWKENPAVRELISDKHISLNDLMRLYGELGLNKNSELIRKMYRDMGYSLSGYWEIFYWETNNDIASEYQPPAPSVIVFENLEWLPLTKANKKQLAGRLKRDILILLERKNPTVYEIHRGEISQEKNLLFSTGDKKLAEGIVNGYNTRNKI